MAHSKIVIRKEVSSKVNYCKLSWPNMQSLYILLLHSTECVNPYVV